MQTLAQLKQQAETIQSIKLITQALGDVATFKLTSTRKFVEQNIDYFQEITQVYRLVKLLAIKANRYHKVKKAKEGKTVSVLLTSNQHFYGGLDTEVTEYFLENSKNIESDKIVVGLMGKEGVIAKGKGIQFESVIFKKDFPQLIELKNLSDRVFQYSRILIFHNKFVTLLNSEPTVSDISASDIESIEASSKSHELPFYYIVEPELEQIVSFFESQILILLFQAVFLEVDIARQAARMIYMNQAGFNADKQSANLRRHLLQARKQKLNTAIIETFSGMMRR